jgi:hypothetical protein
MTRYANTNNGGCEQACWCKYEIPSTACQLYSSTPAYLLTSSIIHTSIPAHVLHHPCQCTCSHPPSSTSAYLLTSFIIHVSVPAHVLHHPRQCTCSHPSSSTPAYLLTSSIIHTSIPAHILHHTCQHTCSHPFTLPSSIYSLSTCSPHLFSLSPPAPPHPFSLSPLSI